MVRQPRLGVVTLPAHLSQNPWGVRLSRTAHLAGIPSPRCQIKPREERRLEMRILGRPAASGERHRGVREIAAVLRAATPTHLHLRARLVFVAVATVAVDAVASVLILLFERHADGTQITNVGDALFWTSTQLLTVSSQLPNPISAPARVLDVFLQAYAISVVAVLAGSFGAFFHRRGIERAQVESGNSRAR
jgi:hypothetical protein